MKAAALLLLAIVKALPAAESVVQHFFALYVSWKKQKNRNETQRKDSRDDAVIDALAAERVSLCASCPYACLGGGQHPGPDAASGVSGSGSGRS